MGKIKVGLIGCGGRQQAHIYHLSDMEDVEIVAIAEPVDERREAAAKKQVQSAFTKIIQSFTITKAQKP